MSRISSRLKLKISITALLLVFGLAELASAQLLPSLGGSRSGTSGFQFLKINVDARSAGMGSSNVADAMDGSAFYVNPALAAQMDDSQVYLSHTAYFVDISMNYASYVHRMGNIALGGSLMYLNSGEMDETNEFNPFGTGRTFRTVHMAAGLSFAQRLTDLFSYGVTAKYLDERIEEVQAQNLVFDFGFFYRVGDTGLRFAIGLNNFGVDATPSGETTRTTLDGEVVETEFEDISPPTTFIIGAAFDAWRNDEFNVLVTGQITNPSDNAERLSLGTEVGYMDQFYLRAGYEFGVDESNLPSFGAGFKLPVANYDIGLDYGFTSRERLGSLHRLALKFNL
jgi:hypothetical protein